jgi:hypothetical protein
MVRLIVLPMAELALVLALGWLAGCLGSSPNAEFGDAGRYDSLVLARFWEPQARLLLRLLLGRRCDTTP